MANKFIYSDINSRTPTLNPLVFDIQSVYQSLYNLFNTRVGERLFLPEFGFPLDDYLFEVIDDATAFSIYSVVVSTITRWETRIVLDTFNTKVTADPDNNKYDLFLVFQMVGISDQSFSLVGSFTQ